MAEPVIISWTPANWLTITLMVAVAFLIAASVSKIIKQRQANATS